MSLCGRRILTQREQRNVRAVLPVLVFCGRATYHFMSDPQGKPECLDTTEALPRGPDHLARWPR